MVGSVVTHDFSAAQGDYPLAHTEATKMLAAAIERASEEKQWSQRAIAKMLNYKTSVVLSHMALGRVPIPVDRAMDFARLLKMDPGAFVIAVLEQRHPDIDFRRIFAAFGKAAPKAMASDSITLSELESIAGGPLDELPVHVINVLRDVVSDRNAPRRWMQVREVPVIEALRKAHPDGLSPTQLKALTECIEAL